jgi:hypothetical protein
VASKERMTEERKARNEVIFRDANESVRAVQEDLGLPEGRMPFICECEDAECRQIVRVLQADYERIRAHARRFLIAPGHEPAGRFVEQHHDYGVVEKDGIAGQIAEATDPRADD